MWRREVSGDESWTSRDYDMANVLDLLNLINVRLAGADPRKHFRPVDRPGDRRRREERRRKAHRAREVIENTKWEEVD